VTSSPSHKLDLNIDALQDSTTVHTWHSGRAVYTLIKVPDDRAQAGTTDRQAEVKRVVMGDSLKDGETMILVVPPGWWKRSQTLSPDGHCLISETVTPAWVPEDHRFMTLENLKEAVRGEEDLLRMFSDNVLPKGHQLEF
jgi:predicted cupin superfamily sugar epimerase